MANDTAGRQTEPFCGQLVHKTIASLNIDICNGRRDIIHDQQRLAFPVAQFRFEMGNPAQKLQFISTPPQHNIQRSVTGGPLQVVIGAGPAGRQDSGKSIG